MSTRKPRHCNYWSAIVIGGLKGLCKWYEKGYGDIIISQRYDRTSCFFSESIIRRSNQQAVGSQWPGLSQRERERPKDLIPPHWFVNRWFIKIKTRHDARYRVSRITQRVWAERERECTGIETRLADFLSALNQWRVLSTSVWTIPQQRIILGWANRAYVWEVPFSLNSAFKKGQEQERENGPIGNSNKRKTEVEWFRGLSTISVCLTDKPSLSLSSLDSTVHMYYLKCKIWDQELYLSSLSIYLSVCVH